MKNKVNRFLALLIATTMIVALTLTFNPLSAHAGEGDYAEPVAEIEYVPEPVAEPEPAPEPVIETEPEVGEVEEVEEVEVVEEAEETEEAEVVEEVEEVEAEEYEPEVDNEFTLDSVIHEISTVELTIPMSGECPELLGLVSELDELIAELTELRDEINEILYDLRKICVSEMTPEILQIYEDTIALLEFALELVEGTLGIYQEMRNVILELVDAGFDIDDLRDMFEADITDDITWDDFWEWFMEKGWLEIQWGERILSFEEFIPEAIEDGGDNLDFFYYHFGFCGPEYGCPCYPAPPPPPPPPPPTPPPVVGGDDPPPAPAPTVTIVAPQTGDVAPASTPFFGVLLSLFLLSGGMLIRKRTN
jgi:hypothetical protein